MLPSLSSDSKYVCVLHYNLHFRKLSPLEKHDSLHPPRRVPPGPCLKNEWPHAFHGRYDPRDLPNDIPIRHRLSRSLPLCGPHYERDRPPRVQTNVYPREHQV
jgi:hypothetical protein